jgi:hypothetical protein
VCTEGLIGKIKKFVKKGLTSVEGWLRLPSFPLEAIVESCGFVREKARPESKM